LEDILKLIFGRQFLECGFDLYEKVACFFEYGNGASGFIRGCDFDEMSVISASQKRL
jgi:hypothetical protein